MIHFLHSQAGTGTWHTHRSRSPLAGNHNNNNNHYMECCPVYVNKEIAFSGPSSRPTGSDVIVRLFDFIFPGQRTNQWERESVADICSCRRTDSPFISFESYFCLFYSFFFCCVIQTKETVNRCVCRYRSVASHFAHGTAMAGDNEFHSSNCHRSKSVFLFWFFFSKCCQHCIHLED